MIFKYFNAFIEEIKLSLEIYWSYKVNLIFETFYIGLLYLGLLYFDSGQRLSLHYGNIHNYKSLLLIGYVFWSFSIAALSVSSSCISSESMRGTLEQKFMSIVPMYVLIAGEFLANILVQLIEISIIVLISHFILGVKFYFEFSIIIILLITLTGMYGIGLTIAGISIREKKINGLVFIIQTMLLFVSDVITSTDSKFVVNKFIPLTLGNDLARKSISKIDILFLDWMQLIFVSFIWLAVGIFVFNYFLKVSKKEGLLGLH